MLVLVLVLVLVLELLSLPLVLMIELSLQLGLVDDAGAAVVAAGGVTADAAAPGASADA